MSGFLFIVAGVVSLLLPCVVIWLAWPTRRGATLLKASAAILAPLGLLSLYLVYQYSFGRWILLPKSSLVPHALAGLIFVAFMGITLITSTAPAWAKIAVGAFASVGWLVLWFVTTLFTLCGLGDCI